MQLSNQPSKSIEERIVGLSVRHATEIAEKAGLLIRAVVIDGEHQLGTMDHNARRLNVEVQDGLIVKCSKRG